MSAFHEDERLAQQLAGVVTTGRGIHSVMPDQHRTFFAELPYIFISTEAEDGAPICTVLTGSPGFISSPNDRTLRLHFDVNKNNWLLKLIRLGKAVGRLGIDLERRRRNRANGIVSKIQPGAFTISVNQSFGNCPKYIWPRKVLPWERPREPRLALDLSDTALGKVVDRADTFFVASRSAGSMQESGGMDMSHRAGPPGFIERQGRRLLVPDYKGNGYFNTLGNLLGDSRVALMFIDFSNGDALFIDGKASINWDQHAPSIERFWTVTMHRATLWRRAVDLQFTLTGDKPIGVDTTGAMA